MLVRLETHKTNSRDYLLLTEQVILGIRVKGATFNSLIPKSAVFGF